MCVHTLMGVCVCVRARWWMHANVKLELAGIHLSPVQIADSKNEA